VVKTSDGLESSASGREGKSLLGGRGIDAGEDHLRINLDLRSSLLETLKDLLHCLDEGISLVSSDGELSSGKGRNGIVSIATVHLVETILSTSKSDVIVEDHLSEPLGGIGTANLDVDTAVATLEVLKGEGVVDEALAVRSTAHGEAEDTIDTTSAAESDLSPVLRVDVDEVLGLLGKKLALLQAKSANKTSLLINGEEKLDGTVLKGLVRSDGKSSGNTTAIITTKSGLGSTKELTIDVRDKRISLKVEGKICSLGGHHIKMCLEDDAREVLLALSSRDGDANVAEMISLHLTADLLAELLNPLGDLLSVMRRTRDLSESKEVLPKIRALRILSAKLLIDLLLCVKVQFCCHREWLSLFQN